MARPTQRLYLIVFAAILLLGGGGGWLAANWRGLAAAYYVRRAENLDAAPAVLRDALARVEHYDRRWLVAFWEREMAAINRLEAEKHPPLTDALYATVETERLVLRTGEEIQLTAVFHNPTDRKIERPRSHEVRTHVCSPSVWAANRRSPEKWLGSAIPSMFSYRMGRGRGPARLTAPHDVARSDIGVPTAMYDLSSHYDRTPPGLYRIKVSWPASEATGGQPLERWLTVRVLPRVGEPEEEWSAAPTLEDSRHDSFLIEYE